MPTSPSRWIVTVCFLCLLSPGILNAQGSTPISEATPEASGAPMFGIFPIGDYENQWFELTFEAGQSVNLTAGIHNSGAAPVSLRTYATNALNLPNGGFEAGTEEDELNGPSLWIDYTAATFELQPEGIREQGFSVTVPDDTAPGEYFIALVVQTSDSLEIPGTDALRQIIRSTISVEITVPGEMTSGFTLGNPDIAPSGAEWMLDVPITNTGTTRIRPVGNLVVTTSSGEMVSTKEIVMGSVYGDNSTVVRAFLPRQLPLGEYLVSLHLTDEATGATDSIQNVSISLAEPKVVVEEKPTFEVDAASVTPNGEPVQYADVAAVITNNGSAIPTANVTLNVQRNGEDVESYPLAENQALPQGTTDFSQRYIPVDGWQPGTYTFELVISAVSGDTETVLATVEIPDEIVVP